MVLMGCLTFLSRRESLRFGVARSHPRPGSNVSPGPHPVPLPSRSPFALENMVLKEAEKSSEGSLMVGHSVDLLANCDQPLSHLGWILSCSVHQAACARFNTWTTMAWTDSF